MGLFSDIISAVGNAANDVGNFFTGDNNQNQKKQQPNTPAPNNNGGIKMPNTFGGPSNLLSKPNAPAPIFTADPITHNTNLVATPHPLAPNINPAPNNFTINHPTTGPSLVVNQPSQPSMVVHPLAPNINPAPNNFTINHPTTGPSLVVNQPSQPSMVVHPITPTITPTQPSMAQPLIPTGGNYNGANFLQDMKAAAVQLPLSVPEAGIAIAKGIVDTPATVLNLLNTGANKVTGDTGTPGFIQRADQYTNDANKPFNAANNFLQTQANKAPDTQGANLYKAGVTTAGALTSLAGGEGVLSKLGIASDAEKAAAGGEAANIADEAAPLENTSAETGTKSITEKPTNAPTGEPTEPTTAPGATESGTKSVTPPPAPVTTVKPLGNVAPTTTVPAETPPAESVPAPANVTDAEKVAQDAVNKTVVNPPTSEPAPVATAPAITPAQAAEVKAAASPTEQAAEAEPALEKTPPEPTIRELDPNTGKQIEVTQEDLLNQVMELQQIPKDERTVAQATLLNDKVNALKNFDSIVSGPPKLPTEKVVNNKDVPTETSPAKVTPTSDEKPLTDLERNPNAVGNLPQRQKWLSSKVQAIRNTNTDSGTALADKIDAADARHTELRAGWMHDLKPVFDLNKKDFRDAWNIQEGKLNVRNASQAARDAAATLKQVMPDIQKTADKADVVEGNLGDTYMPHTFKDVKSGPTVNMPKGVNTGPKTVGNLEKERLTNAQNYEKTPNALMNYIDKVSQRIGQSENFGAKNEIAKGLIAKIGAEGGDQGTADEAFGNYMHTDFPNTTASKVQRGVNTAFSLARLPTAAISHLGQTANTAVDAGIGKTLGGWARYLSRNSKDADFVDRTGVTNPQSLGHYQNDYTSVKGVASRFIAPGLRPVMKMNRSVTALAYRAYGNALAKAGNVEKLQELGVKGDIGSKLTDAQELQVARGGVQKTMFSGSKAQTPIKAETTGGRIIGQYRTAYALPQTKFIINSVLKEAAKGNIAPLARYLTISAGVGAGALAAKNAITGKSQSKGSTAATIAGSLGGIPGEMVSSAAQYGKSNVVGTVASDIAPMAGEAVKVGTAIQNSLSSKNPTPIERYGLKLAPVIGGRLANKFTPYAPGSSKSQVAAGAKQSNPGIYQVKAKDGTAQFATLDGKSMKNYSTLTDAQAAQAKNEFKYSSAGKQITSNNAQQALDKDNFIKSGQQEQSIHGMVYQNEGNGKVSSMEQKDFDYKTADDGMTTAKNNDDLKGYVTSATALLGNINWQLKHANLTDSQRSALTNKATTTENDLAKYQGYGGFTKGSSGSTGYKAGTPQLTLSAPSLPSDLKADTTASYKAPTLVANKAPTSTSINPFVRSISAAKGVK
jgi:hypothetical protein